MQIETKKMLNISTIEFKNFYSYGDYITTIDLNDRGPTLVVGNSCDDESISNGVGKSSLTAAIIWCLFGRTPTKHNPGDNVINWYTKSDCYVKIDTTDGYTIMRTRGVNNHDDLLLFKDGVDISASTNKNTQILISRTFNLDYDIFVSSMFFGQKTDSFMSMSDVKRRATLERLLGIDKFNIYGDVAKDMKIKLEAEQQLNIKLVESKVADLNASISDRLSIESKKIKHDDNRKLLLDGLTSKFECVSNELSRVIVDDTVSDMIREVNEIRDKIKMLSENLLKYSSSKSKYQMHLSEMSDKINKCNDFLSKNVKYDIASIENEHALYDDLSDKRSSIQDTMSELKVKCAEYDTELRLHKNRVVEIFSKVGKCYACQQDVSQQHCNDLAEPINTKINNLISEKAVIENKISKMANEFNSIKLIRPKVSVQEATKHNDSIDQITSDIETYKSKVVSYSEMLAETESAISKHERAIKLLNDKINNSDLQRRIDDYNKSLSQKRTLEADLTIISEGIRHETDKINPYIDMLSMLDDKINNIRLQVDNAKKIISDLDTSIMIYDYLKKSYHDRNKIKMMLLSDIIPFFNERIKYYLNSFECDFDIVFTDTLNIETSKWQYDFYSGGQQKRIDLAIMFAMYDLYISMHGMQCNVMVLDEIDGSLDHNGVRMFIDVINNDFSGDREDKPSTILIISHKNEMVDQFSGKIMINRDAAGFSRLHSQI